MCQDPPGLGHDSRTNPTAVHALESRAMVADAGDQVALLGSFVGLICGGRIFINHVEPVGRRTVEVDRDLVARLVQLYGVRD